MQKRMMSVMILIMIVAIWIACCGESTGMPRGQMLPMERAILACVNAEREKAGLRPLQYDENAQKVAGAKAKEMEDYDYFSHESPLSGGIENQFSLHGQIVLGEGGVWEIGENLAKLMGYEKEEIAAQLFMKGWMESEGHRENILNPNYTHMGAAVYRKGSRCFAAQEFMAVREGERSKKENDDDA